MEEKVEVKEKKDTTKTKNKSANKAETKKIPKEEKKVSTKKNDTNKKETSTKKSTTTPKSNQKKVTKVNVKVQTKTVKKAETPEKSKTAKKETTPKTKNAKNEENKKTHTAVKSSTSKKSNTKKESDKKQEAKNLDEKNDEMDELITQISTVIDEVQIEEKLEESDKESDKKELVNPEVIKKNELDTIKEALKNNLIGIVVIIYFLALIIGKESINTIEYITDLKVFIILETIISIVIIEKAYKKDTFSIAINGIEMLVLGGSTVLILDLFNKQNDKLNLVFAILVGIFTFYYLLKMLVLAIKKDKKKK